MPEEPLYILGENQSRKIGSAFFLAWRVLNWSKSLLAVQWAVQDSQRFCLRINFAWDQRDWIGEVVARWNDFNSQQLNSFPDCVHNPAFLAQPKDEVEQCQFWPKSVEAWAAGLSSLGRPKKEFAAFFGEKKHRLFFLAHILRKNNPQNIMLISQLNSSVEDCITCNFLKSILCLM